MREPQPYFRKFDGWWYVQIVEGGRRVQHKLVKGADREEEAYAEYHALMAGRPSVCSTSTRRRYASCTSAVGCNV